MICRSAVVAGLLLILVTSLAQAQPATPEQETPAFPGISGVRETSGTPEAPLATPRALEAEPESAPPPEAEYADDPELSHLTFCEGSGGSFVPPIGYDYYFRPHYARVDALFLQRTNTVNGQTVVQTSGTGAPVVVTGDFDFPMVAGPKILLGKRSDAYSAWEGLYFGTHFWGSTVTASDADNLDLPGAVGLGAADFLLADEMAVSYSSQLHNAELNYVRLGDEVSYLAGFRYLNWNERFLIRSEDNVNHSLYDLNTTNNLFGAQLGAQACWIGPHVDWELIGKAGIFGNTANARQRLSDINDTVALRDLEASGSSFSFVGDLNLNAVRRLDEVWQLRVGYNVMLVTGLALAPDQLDFTNTPTSGTRLDREGSVFLHGANVGIEAQW